jgi:hypothetical protein
MNINQLVRYPYNTAFYALPQILPELLHLNNSMKLITNSLFSVNLIFNFMHTTQQPASCN